VSAGVVDGKALLDLRYDEDSRAEVDMNFVDDRGRRVRRGAGHGGVEAVHAGPSARTDSDLAWRGVKQLDQDSSTTCSRRTLEPVAAPLSRPTLLIATTNPGKFREFGALLADMPVALQSLADRPVRPPWTRTARHTRKTPWLKARAICGVGGVCDAGRTTPASKWTPSVGRRECARRGTLTAVMTRRNIAKLLDAFVRVPAVRRSARFRCVLVVACPGGATLRAEGRARG